MHSFLQLPFKPGYNYQHYFQKLKPIQVSIKLFLKKLQSARYKGLTHFHSYAGLQFLQNFNLVLLILIPECGYFVFNTWIMKNMRAIGTGKR